jgi:SAM-dependent methyltransferase
MEREMEANRRRWDELVPIHEASRFYDVDGFKRGRNTLLPIEEEELGDVVGKKLLHLQCHFGLDTLSLARKGAEVTGVDFSQRAIDAATRLGQELGIPARFITSNVYDLPSVLDEEFDIVFTSYGVICWLPDLMAWAKVIARHLRKGGTFLLVEDHPLAALIDEKTPGPIRMAYPYFTSGEATRFDVQGTYTDREAKVDNCSSFEWTHSISDILNSLVLAGLSIASVHEYPFSFFKRHDSMVMHRDGTWHFTDPTISFPMILSVRATKSP